MRSASVSHRLARLSRRNGPVYTYTKDQLAAINNGDSISNHKPVFFADGNIHGIKTGTLAEYALGLDHNGNKVH